MKNSRHEPSWFLMIFPMVYTASSQLHGIYWDTGTILSKSWELPEIDVRRIDAGAFRWCLGVIRKSLECFWMLMDAHGAKHSPQGQQGDASLGNMGSSTKRSRSPFDPTYLYLRTMKCNNLDMNPHSSLCSFQWYPWFSVRQRDTQEHGTHLQESRESRETDNLKINQWAFR